jgi:hypothetical protein
MPKKNKINIYDASHSDRQKAIKIIEEIIEPLLKREIIMDEYYKLEDDLTLIINQ